MNPDWEIILLNQDDANEHVDRRELPLNMKVAAYSDLLRVKILKENGGVWADATCLCMKPLDDFILGVFSQCDFFAFYRPGKDRLVSSWFLASTKNSRLMHDWCRLSEFFWKWPVTARYPYFWFHCLFEYLIFSSIGARRSWGMTPKLSADPSHLLQWHLQGKRGTEAHFAAMRATYIQKLTYKSKFSLLDLEESLQNIRIPNAPPIRPMPDPAERLEFGARVLPAG
jgi:hypothetical protein